MKVIKSVYFMFIVDKIKLILTNWKACLLSIAGMLQLVKTVIQSMIVHCISVYNGPATLIKQISNWMRNFIWSGCIDQKKLVTVVWKSCCKGLKEGRFGIKSLYYLNVATNLHLC